MKNSVVNAALKLEQAWQDLNNAVISSSQCVFAEIIENCDPFSVFEQFDIIQEKQNNELPCDDNSPINLASSVAQKTTQDSIDAGNLLTHDKVANIKEVFLQKSHHFAVDLYTRMLSEHFANGGIPISGIALAFSEGCKHCYVIEYSSEFGRPEINFAGRIEQPTGLMSVESIGMLPSAQARNAAKRFLTSGHKVVIHKNSLTHVDRRYEDSVFGPTIDTLILADLACEISAKMNPTMILEIGCGNGHIITSLAMVQNEALSAIHFWDVNGRAILCTERNLTANLSRITEKKIRKLGFFGEFEASLLKNKYDLIVCNPPYIAEHLDGEERDIRRYGEAVSGTHLIDQMLQQCDSILTDQGKVIMMISSASLLLETLQKDQRWDVEILGSEDGYRVPFDVEAVLIDPNRVADLEHKFGIFRTSEHSFEHILYPLQLQKVSDVK